MKNRLLILAISCLATTVQSQNKIEISALASFNVDTCFHLSKDSQQRKNDPRTIEHYSYYEEYSCKVTNRHNSVRALVEDWVNLQISHSRHQMNSSNIKVLHWDIKREIEYLGEPLNETIKFEENKLIKGESKFSIHRYFRIPDASRSDEKRLIKTSSDGTKHYAKVLFDGLYAIKINTVIKNDRFEVDVFGPKEKKEMIDNTADLIIASFKNLSKKK